MQSHVHVISVHILPTVFRLQSFCKKLSCWVASCSTSKENGPCGPCIWVLGTKLVELRGNYQVWHCLRRSVIWRQILRLQKHTLFLVSIPCLVLLDQDANSKLLLQHHACLSAAMLTAMTVMDSPFWHCGL